MTQFIWYEPSGSWILKIYDNKDWELNTSYCSNDVGMCVECGDEINEITATDKRFDYFNSNTIRIMSISWASVDAGNIYSPFILIRDRLKYEEDFSGDWGSISDKQFVWKDSNGNYVGVLDIDGNLYISKWLHYSSIGSIEINDTSCY